MSGPDQALLDWLHHLRTHRRAQTILPDEQGDLQQRGFFVLQIAQSSQLL